MEKDLYVDALFDLAGDIHEEGWGLQQEEPTAITAIDALYEMYTFILDKAIKLRLFWEQDGGYV